MILKKDNVTIFILSIFFALSILLIENLIGINIDYHPDSSTYLDSSHPNLFFDFLKNPTSYLGSFYYVLVSFFRSEIIFLISLNIFLFAFTNLILFSKVRNFYNRNGLLFYFSVLIIIFDPYRAHLSVHILKDTGIIFFSVLFFFSSSIFSRILSLLMGFMFRWGFFIYLPIIFLSNFKNKSFYFILIFIIFFLYKDIIYLGLLHGQEVDMSFRSFDTIPDFIEFGYPWGDILRIVSWPLIRLTGLAFIFQPIYFLFFFQSIAAFYLIIHNSHNLRINLFILFVIFAGVALVTTGYNSYLRWTQPVITVLPILSSLSFFNITNRVTKV